MTAPASASGRQRLFDAHLHIVDPAHPLVENQGYLPELHRRLGLRPAECLAVEDSLNGATAAVAAGMPVVVVPNDVTRTQPFPPEWRRLDAGYAGGLAALLGVEETPAP